MQFDLTADQKAVARSVADLLTRNLPESDLVARFDRQDLDQALWRDFAALGTGAILVPAVQEGLGMDMLTLAQVAEQVGRAGAALPAVHNALAAWVIARAGSAAQQQRWLGPLMAGEVIAAFALSEAGAPLPVDWQIDGPVLAGSKPAVEWGAQADLLIVGTRGGRLWLVDADAPGLTRTRVDAVDGNTPLADVVFDGVSAAALSAATGLADELCDALLIMLSSEAFGAAARALDMAADYARMRSQFGRMIGSFQGMKHQFANLAAELEPCKALCWFAAHAWDALPDQRARAAATAKAHVTDVAVRVTRMTVELHGGIGYTWEYPLHVFLKRAMRCRATLGLPMTHRARVAVLAGW